MCVNEQNIDFVKQFVYVDSVAEFDKTTLNKKLRWGMVQKSMDPL